MFYERTVSQTIRNVNDTFPVLLVTGPRQVGKTTLLEKLASPDRKRVSLLPNRWPAEWASFPCWG